MRSANLEAIAHAHRGIEALGHLPDGHERTGWSLTCNSLWGPA